MSSPENRVSAVLEDYAKRGVFRGFSRGPARTGRAVFKMLWHRDRIFELILDGRRQTLRFPLVLPGVPGKSAMYREFQQFVEARHSVDLPEHRRIDRAKTAIECGNRAGAVSITATVLDGDYEYAARKLINLVHETYLVFLYDGRYYDYLIETFDVDPDRPV